MNWWIYGAAAVALIAGPLVVMWAVNHWMPFVRFIWSMREREYPMPQSWWTVADLHRQARRTLVALERRGAYHDEAQRLRALIARLAAQESRDSVKAVDVAEWLDLRDLGSL